MWNAVIVQWLLIEVVSGQGVYHASLIKIHSVKSSEFAPKDISEIILEYP